LKIIFQEASIVGVERVPQVLEVREVIVPQIILSFGVKAKLLY